MKMALVVCKDEIITDPFRIPADLTKFRTKFVRLWSCSRSSVWTLARVLTTLQVPVATSTVDGSGALTDAEAILSLTPYAALANWNSSVGASRHYTQII